MAACSGVVPGRTALAYASGVLMLLCGIGLLFQATSWLAVRILFVYLILWTLLKVPALVVAPQIEGVWLGIGELVMLLAGGWILFARLARLKADSFWAFATGEKSIRVAQILFGVFLIPIGLSHLMYGKGTAEFVPAWLPYRLGWAYLTGVGQMACGLGVLFSILPRVAAMAEAIMVSLFTLLIWLPSILHTPKARMSWTAFFVSWAFGAGAWVVASNLVTKRWSDLSPRSDVESSS